MQKLLHYLGLTIVFALSTTTADASLISISETATGGGGTLVSDGSGDVSSSDGSAGGPGIDALLLSSYGITNGNLAGDLAQFTITGSFSDSAGEATSVSLANLWLIGTLDGSPLPACSTCGFLNDVNLGSSLSFFNLDANGNIITNPQNVLFAVALVGALTPAAWVGPGNLASPQIVPIGANAFTYGLTSDQILFITGRMSGLGFSVDQVRLGLSARADGIAPITVLNPLGQQDVRQVYDLEGPASTSVPEPGSLVLLATGLATTRLWRKGRQLFRDGVR